MKRVINFTFPTGGDLEIEVPGIGKVKFVVKSVGDDVELTINRVQHTAYMKVEQVIELTQLYLEAWESDNIAGLDGTVYHPDRKANFWRVEADRTERIIFSVWGHHKNQVGASIREWSYYPDELAKVMMLLNNIAVKTLEQ